MGGFGGPFRYSADEKELLTVLMAGVSRRCRAYGVKWRYSLARTGVAQFTMDGNWTRMRLLVDKLAREMPVLAEGYVSFGQPSFRRKKASGLINIVGSYLYGRYDDRDEGYVPLWRASKEARRYMVLDFWLGDEHSDLTDRLAITIDVISAWAFDEVAPEVVLEELHTAASLLLMRRANLRRAPAFKELVDREVQAGGLNKELWFTGYPDFRSTPSMSEVLLGLKSVRAAAKHQGLRGGRDWLELNFWGVVTTLEYIAECIRVGAPQSFQAVPSDVIAQVEKVTQLLYSEKSRVE
ncbi:hypothetical protein [Melissospora conviva]|uniref:hypothetical protein n=1 Tax=Melissospora conviva TaxID=3388432 RepID=UPI003C1F43A8